MYRKRMLRDIFAQRSVGRLGQVTKAFRHFFFLYGNRQIRKYQSINQSVNQSTNQPTNQPINQSINQSMFYLPHSFSSLQLVKLHVSVFSKLLNDTKSSLLTGGASRFTKTWFGQLTISVFNFGSKVVVHLGEMTISCMVGINELI